MQNDSHSSIAFYCPLHQIRFHTVAGDVIECDRSPHALGSGFPRESPWTYCCDCATFSPYEPLTRTDRLRECLVCERQTTRRYLCCNCQVMSVESNAIVRRKAYSIDKSVQPACPGCGSTAPSCVVEHKCEEIGTSFLTSRSTCLFCDLEIDSPAQMTPGPKPQVQTPDVPVLTIAEPDIEVDTLEDWDDTEPDYAETDEVAATTSPPASWDFAVPQAPPERKTKWVVGGVVALVSLTILITVVSTGGRRNDQPRIGQPTPTLRPTIPGMVYVAGGEFNMGSDTGDEYERPAHKVRLASFYIDVNEVTCEDYLKFVRDKSHRMPPNWINKSFPPGAARQPVTGVDWYDAAAYAEWAGKRLPTEEEWEFVARGKNGSRYPWGNDWTSNAANAGDSSAQRLTDVGSYPGGKTTTGVMDMIGNAWEWTASDVIPYPGGKLPSSVPNAVKVIRGGSWQEKQQQATTTYRGFLRMSGAEDYSATGFRCVRDGVAVATK